LKIKEKISLPEGFLLSGIHCGIKRKKLDLGLIFCPDFAKTAASFTTNINPSYSVTLCKKNINNLIKAVLVNSGNANCYSHAGGLKDTESIIINLAKELDVKPKNILISSTGIIGKKLPKNKIIINLPALIKDLKPNADNFASSILTTDTFKKITFSQVKAGSKKITISGFAKGAGMIYPNMATMLGFILTDAKLPLSVFKQITKQAVEESFNSISIDGCTSTNDMALFMSSGKIQLESSAQIALFTKELKKVCLTLAKMIVQDAEGATKFIEIKISGAKDIAEAKKAGLCLTNSLLFKCALYGANANWGRIVSALGQAGIKISENIAIKSTSLKEKNVTITIDLKRGKCCWTVYTSDLTPQYIKINAEYS